MIPALIGEHAMASVLTDTDVIARALAAGAGTVLSSADRAALSAALRARTPEPAAHDDSTPFVRAMRDAFGDGQR